MLNENYGIDLDKARVSFFIYKILDELVLNVDLSVVIISNFRFFSRYKRVIIL